MQNKERAEIFLTGWESGLARRKRDYHWMREEYGATDEEIELEATVSLLTLLSNINSEKAEERQSEKLLVIAENIRSLADSIQEMPARMSLSKKHADRSTERMGNVEII
jgi:hypothetical protein